MNSDINNLLKENYKIENKYYAFFEKTENSCNLRILFDNRDDFNYYNKEHYDIINVQSIISNIKLSLINCERCSVESKNGKLQITYEIDRISKFIIKSTNDKIFDDISFSFNDISWFVLDETSYSFDPIKEAVKFKSYLKEYKVSFGVIKIYRKFDFFHGVNKFKLADDIVFNIRFKQKISYNEVIEKIYCFKNFLMIIGRRNLNVTKMFITDNKRKYDIIDCYKEYSYRSLNKRYKEYLDYHTLTLNSLDNFSKMIEIFYGEYEKILSIIDSWFSTLKYTLPTKVNYINATTMVEDYCNLYLKKETKKEVELENKKIKTRFINDILDIINSKFEINENDKAEINEELNKLVKDNNQSSFIAKVKELINNVNEVFNYTTDEIEKISENLRNARTACVHKGIFIDENKSRYVLKYSYFINDVIFLNVLKLCDFDMNFKKLECVEFNYSKDELIYKVNFK